MKRLCRLLMADCGQDAGCGTHIYWIFIIRQTAISDEKCLLRRYATLKPRPCQPLTVGLCINGCIGCYMGYLYCTGRGSIQPIMDTAVNFIRTTPMVIVLVLLTLNTIEVTSLGVIYAVVSGAVASAMGYGLFDLVFRFKRYFRYTGSGGSIIGPYFGGVRRYRFCGRINFSPIRHCIHIGIKWYRHGYFRSPLLGPQ